MVELMDGEPRDIEPSGEEGRLYTCIYRCAYVDYKYISIIATVDTHVHTHKHQEDWAVA